MKRDEKVTGFERMGSLQNSCESAEEEVVASIVIDAVKVRGGVRSRVLFVCKKLLETRRWQMESQACHFVIKAHEQNHGISSNPSRYPRTGNQSFPGIIKYIASHTTPYSTPLPPNSQASPLPPAPQKYSQPPTNEPILRMTR